MLKKLIEYSCHYLYIWMRLHRNDPNNLEPCTKVGYTTYTHKRHPIGRHEHSNGTYNYGHSKSTIILKRGE
jgi:hypothetical protein